jgi:hypothetical protein
MYPVTNKYTVAAHGELSYMIHVFIIGIIVIVLICPNRLLFPDGKNTVVPALYNFVYSDVRI